MKRPCLGVDGHYCGKLTENTRCPDCERAWMRPRYAAKDRRRGTARQRYGATHDQTRARLLPQAYGQACPRCGEPMLPGQALDLGHPLGAPRSKDRSSRADHMEHASCNRGART